MLRTRALLRTLGLILGGGMVISGAAAGESGLSAAPPASSFDAQLTAAYAATFGVSSTIAQDRLALQAAGAELPHLLAEALGNDFGGIWFDNTNGRFNVLVVPNASRTAADAARIVDASAGPAGPAVAEAIDVGPARVSMSALVAQDTLLSARLGVGIREGFARSVVNTQQNRVEVLTRADLTASERDRVNDALRDASVPVSVATAPDEAMRPMKPAVCANVGNYKAGCSRPLRGSVSVQAPTRGRACSLSVFGRTASGNDFAVTAGHCVLPLSSAQWEAYDNTAVVGGSGGRHNIGTGTNGFYDSRGDLGLIRLTPTGYYGSTTHPNYAENPWIGAWAEGQQEYRVRTIGDLMVGTFFGWAGSRTSGFAEVEHYPFSPPGSGLGNLAEARLTFSCPVDGTSGGPLWNTNVLLGVISGSNTTDGATCTHMIATPIRQAVNIWGLSIYTRYP
jgi:hypothetical protein